ncbi:hypothetical protein [Okeania sp. SIO1F9]|uniref:DUF7507 domain-containing protein n=1 Tax=Okeania sp. SIO1F9 TaxID=2607813 RepID=UPI00144E7CED|nr:hypothetical protein [Okeania sp. SIO1F9]NET79487.1 hypothetical protein [Okeania sp. SIO1F9]
MTVTSGDTVRYYYEVSNDGTAELFDLDWTDDNATPGNTTDDFTLADASILKVIDFDGNEFTSGFDSLYGDLDSEGDANDLAPGATVIFYEEVQLSAQGTVINTADAIGNNGASGGNFEELTDSDTATVNVEGTPAIGVTKTADVTSVNAAEQVITYTYTVSNDGDVPLTGITLSDDNFTPADISDDFHPTLTDDGNGDEILDVDESWTYTATYTVTQADLDDGSDLVNVATADSNETEEKTDDAKVDVLQQPNLAVIKTADITEVQVAGTDITYTYTVTNTGNQTLTNVTVMDDNFTPDDGDATNGDETLDDIPIALSSTTLAPGETTTGSYTYTVTQEDINSGADLVNVATADSNESEPKTDDAKVDILQDIDFLLLKTADINEVDTAGQVITYTYTIENTGTVSLTNVSLIDDNFTPDNSSDNFNPTFVSSSDDGNGVLDVGETWEYTATYTVTQDDIDSGTALVNVATADTEETDPKTDNETVTIDQNPNLSILKEANVTEVDAAGEQIVYTYTVKNEGNVTLENVTVTDDNFTTDDGDDIPITLSSTTLAPGETTTGSYTYTVTQADIDSGADLVNVAIADSDQTEPTEDDETVDVIQQPSLSILKEADVSIVSTAGQVITYTYTLKNTGNQSLTNVTLSDDNFTPTNPGDDLNPTFDVSSDNGNGILDVGEIWKYTATHTVTQAEIDTGASLVNVATADSEETEPQKDNEQVQIFQNPSLSILKEADVTEVDAAGEQIVYTYTVKNEGNVTLENVTVTDDNFTPDDEDATNGDETLDDISITLSNRTLAPGETTTGTYTYTVTQADIDSGADLVNVAIADSDRTEPTEDDETVDVVQNPGLSILKEANLTEVDAAGDQIVYTYTVENTGNVTLDNVTVTDDNFTPDDGDATNGDETLDDIPITLSSTTLAPGETTTGTYTYTVTQADIDSAADLVNVAIADSDQTEPTEDDEKVDVLEDADFLLLKEANVDSVDEVGEVITYTYTATNSGNQTLTGFTLSDDNFTPDNPNDDFFPTLTDNGNGDTNLDVGETWTYTATYEVTQADFDSGLDLVNVATADTDQTEPKTDDETVDVVQNPSITLEKVTTDGVVTGDNIGVSAGESISWIYTVTNDGNLNLSNINLIDDPQGVITNLVVDGDGDAILAPNETWIYELTGTAITGSYQNLGTVTGDHSNGQGQVEATDPSSYTGIEGPGVRTPGFWVNWTEVWDGNPENDSRFAERSGFPSGDLLLAPYSASEQAPQVLDPVSGTYQTGLLVGDYNRNGITDESESTIFYSLNEAKSILAAKQKEQKNDKRYTLDRSLVASWLNFTAFNPAPTDDIDNGIAWIQEHTPDENLDGIGDGDLILEASTYAVPANSDFWTESNPIVPNGGELIHTALDDYNNNGLF